LFTSTPTTVENEFWQGFAGTDMRQFFMPCPYCGGEFAFMFTRETMRWDKPESGGVDIDLAAATVRYVCPHCGGEIPETEAE
jgi:phage terminase large subunit GpA-like protein